MKRTTKAYTAFILVTLAVGGLAALLTMGSMEDYKTLAKPTFAPPGWVFPIAWTTLYVFMAVAAARVWLKNDEHKTTSTVLYALQLAVNFFWPIIFFNFGEFMLAFVWLILLLILIVATLTSFRRSDKTATWLFVPYILWTGYASVINYMIYTMNR